jgi:NADH-quinone oxidoreductase subunit J
VAILFYVFAALAVIGALGVVTLRNPMYGAMSLLGTFLSIAALFLLRHAELLAVVQVFVYGGGILVLFLFVIMLVNLHRLPETRRFDGQTAAALALSLLLLGVFGWLLLPTPFGPGLQRPEVFVQAGGQAAGNSQAVAWALFTQHLLPFEIASVFLLVAMIGAVVLGRRQ